jgi:hypothetical protein
MNKSSTGYKILAFARAMDGWFTAADVVYAAKGKSKSNIYVALSALKKAGKLVHDPGTKSYRLNENSKTITVTAPKAPTLAPPNPPKHPKPEKPPLDPARKNDVQTISWLVDQNTELNQKVQKLEEQYEDALSVIRYLEDKLIRTIQYTAQFEEGKDDA